MAWNSDFTPEEWNKILNWFNSDHNIASQEYLNIHKGLVRFFKKEPNPNECADETLRRGILKFSETMEKPKNINEKITFFLKFAHYIIKENRKNLVKEKNQVEMENFPDTKISLLDNLVNVEEEFIKLEILKTCLEKLSDEDSNIFSSYAFSGHDRNAKNLLAEKFGLTYDNLRKKYSRLIDIVENCCKSELKKRHRL